MNNPLKGYESKLPKGTVFDFSLSKYKWRGFTMERRFFIINSVYRVFDWRSHVDITFRTCMKPMTDRFMRVV